MRPARAARPKEERARLIAALWLPFCNPSAVSRRREKDQIRLRHQLGAAEGSGEAQGEQRAVAGAGERVGAERQHLLEHVRGGGRLPLTGGADGPADAAQDRPHPLLVGRRLVAGDLVPVADGGGLAPDGGRFAAAISEPGQIGSDDANMGRAAPEGALGNGVRVRSEASTGRSRP